MNTKGIVPAVLAALVLSGGCRRAGEPATAEPKTPRPSILLVTLDTTRADSIGPGATGVDTPSFNMLAARGRVYRHAYASVPETLPSHTSIMTGLYPAGHGVHENARTLSSAQPVVAEQLQKAGYRTTAFVSSFVLARRFGLGRGFDVYDDNLRRRTVGTIGGGDDRRCTRRTAARQRSAKVHLGALLRSALPVHAARAVSQPVCRGRRISVRLPRWTTSSGACSPPSTSARRKKGIPPPSSSSQIMAKGSGTMGSRSMATFFINPRCTYRWSWPRQGSPRGRATPPSAPGASITRCCRGRGLASATVSSMPVQPWRGMARRKRCSGNR